MNEETSEGMIMDNTAAINTEALNYALKFHNREADEQIDAGAVLETAQKFAAFIGG